MSYLGVVNLDSSVVLQPDGTTAQRQRVTIANDDPDTLQLLRLLVGFTAAMWQMQGQAFGTLVDPTTTLDDLTGGE